MKNWEYYDKPEGIEYFDFGYMDGYRRKLIETINGDKLTSAERETALKSVPTVVRQHMKLVNQPYNDACRRLTEEFWADARAELGYEDLLEAPGVGAIESLAYEKGHSSGFPEVYSQLQDLVALVREILTHQKKTPAANPLAGFVVTDEKTDEHGLGPIGWEDQD